MKLYGHILMMMAALILLPSFSLSSPTGRSPQQDYIARYAETAIRERQRSGVPASITLAQGMLESSNGLSELAVKGRNHFGIKCHDWKGGRVYFDDDRKGECFRKYRTVDESYRDHSDFLRYRDRYKFLFDFRVTDYKSWAYGLRKAGYATDPAYPQKLIRIIEEYDLARFDRRSTQPLKERRKRGGDIEEPAPTVREDIQEEVTVPETPTELETPKPLSDRQGREFNLSLTRQLFSQNGVPFVYSVEGETYRELARRYHLFFKEILNYNDLEEDGELLPGTIVYLQPKKKYAARHVDKYIAEGGETLREIAQRYAVKLKTILRINGLEPDQELREGDTLLLRK